VSEARLLLWEQWVGDCFDTSVDESLEDFKGDTQQRYRTIALWIPNGVSGLGIATTSAHSPDLWNFELAHAGVSKSQNQDLRARPGVAYELCEDGVHSRRLSWLQASEGSSKLFRPEGFRDTVIFRCWNLP